MKIQKMGNGTKLTKEQESKYTAWKKGLPTNLQYEGDYDLRGFWKDNPTWNPNDPNSHMTDKYKLPNHPTFSDESMYFNPQTRNQAGHWNDNMYVPYNPAVKDTIVDQSEQGQGAYRIKNGQKIPIEMSKGGKIIKKKKMADGGPITDDERSTWQNMQGKAYQSGFLGDNHSKQPGVDFMQANGIDPSRLPAFQADLAAKGQENPWGKGAGAKAPRGFSGADGHYGDMSATEQYTNYAVQYGNEPAKNFGTNWQAATQYNNQRQADEYKGFGDPTQDVNYKVPGDNSGFGASPQGTSPTAPQGLAATGFPTLAEAKANARPQQDNWYTDDNSSYGMHGDAGEEMGKGGRIRRKIKRMGTGDLVEPNLDNKTPDAWTPTSGLDARSNEAGLAPAGQPGQQNIYQAQNQYDKSYPVQNQPGNRPGSGTEPMDMEPPEQPQDQPAQAPQASRQPSGNSGSSMGVTLNTMPLISGADALVNQMYNAHMKGNEANLMRQNMQQVKGPMNYNGSEMLTYGQGGAIDPFITHPSQANQMIEKGEYVKLPNGSGGVAPGWKHDDPNGPGGTPTNLPGNSQVLSDQDKPDLSFTKELTNGRIKKKATYAEIGAKYDVSKYQKVLKNPKSDPIAKNTANLNIEYNNSVIDQAFAHQEMMKNPMSVMPEMRHGGLTWMAKGGSDPNILSYQQSMMQDHPDWVNEALAKYGQPNAGRFDDGLDGPRTQYVKNYVNTKSGPTPQFRFDQNPTQDNTPPVIPYVSDLVGPGVPEEDTPDPNQASNQSPTKNVDITRKGKGNGFTMGQAGVPGFLPGAVAAINALNKYPIPSQKYQPEYLGHMEGLNIDPALNRTLALTRGAAGNSGNASIDQARALSALAIGQDADQQQYANKFNHDAAQEYGRRAANVQTKNQADLYNIQQMQSQWGKMTQREANKEGAIQQIANNAYTNSRQAMLDKNSQELAGEFFPNYDYKPGQGIKFDPSTGSSIVHAYNGQGASQAGYGSTVMKDKEGNEYVFIKGPDGKPKRQYIAS